MSFERIDPWIGDNVTLTDGTVELAPGATSGFVTVNDTLMAAWFGELAEGWSEVVRRFAELVASGRIEGFIDLMVPRQHGRTAAHQHFLRDYGARGIAQFVPRRCEVTIIDDLDPYHPDAHTVRFSEMSAEAEAELAAWDEMLHGRKSP